MSISEPAKIITPWASTGSKNPIPASANNATGAAGFDKGFPDITMTPEEAGGLPPAGQDFNGIFYQITEIIQYMQAGGQPLFSPVLSTAIGGYPKGCVVLGSDDLTLWQNQVDGNTSDPSSLPTGWLKLDVNLKSLLASSSGAAMIGRGVATVDADLLNLESFTGQQYSTAGCIGKLLAGGIAQVIPCYGDSTMWGATVGNLAIQSPNNPPAILREAVNLLYGISVSCPNRAISGSTLRGMISGTDGSGSAFGDKIKAGGVDFSANAIICNHGINDSQNNLDIVQYKKDLEEFVRLCRINGKVPVLATPNPNPASLGLPSPIITEEKSKRLRNYVNVMRSVAMQTGCDLVDQFKFFEESTTQFRIEEIVPDGAHLSDAAYRQAGFNLAIPFICVSEIGLPGSQCGLENTTYFDNFTASRQLQYRGARTGSTLSGERTASLQGVNFPFVLSRGVNGVSVLCLEYDDAANCDTSINSVNSGPLYPQKQFGNQSYQDWSADRIIDKKLFAGLNVLNVAFNLVSPGNGVSLTFSGVRIPAQYVASVTGTAAQDNYSPEFLTSGSTLSCSLYFGAAGEISLVDKSNSTVCRLYISTGTVKADMYKNGLVVSTNTLGSGVSEGYYDVTFTAAPASLAVVFGGISVVIPTATTIPSCKLYSPNTKFILQRLVAP